MADIFQKLYMDNQNKKDPFQRLAEANARQGSNLANALPKVHALYEDLPTAPIALPPQKTIGDHAKDLAVDGAKLLITAEQGVVDLMDLGLYGARKAAEGYQQIGHAIAPNTIPEPNKAKFGVLSKQLDEGLGVNLNNAKHYWEGFYSDPRKLQQQELETGQTKEQINAFNKTWGDAYQNKYAQLQQNGATKEQLGAFTQNFNQRHQAALTNLIGKGDMSTDKSIGENLSILGDKFAYVADNPSLGVGAAVESLGYLVPSRAVAKGVIRGEQLLAEAGKTASERAVMAANGAFKPSAYTAAGIGEGSVAAATIADQLRQESPDGLVDDTGMAAALGAGAITGLIGGAAGKLGARYGIDDIDNVGMQGARLSANEVRQLSAPTKVALGTASEAGQEFLQSIGESVLPNIAQGKDPLTGLASDLALSTFAGGVMGAGTNAPHLLNSGLDAASNLKQKVTDTVKAKLTQASYEDLINPTHEKYNPAAAYQTQLPLVSSEDAEVRKQAEANIEKIQADTASNRDRAAQAFVETQQQIQGLKDLPQLSPELQEQLNELEAALPDQLNKFKQLNTHYLDLQTELSKTEDHQNVQTGNQITEQQVKDSVSVLSQADLTPEQTQQAVGHVTKFMSQYDSNDLLALSSSQYFTPEQRGSLRQLAESKIKIAEAQTTNQVNDNIINGLKGRTNQESHRGIVDYESMVQKAISTNNTRLLDVALTDLGSFTQNHANKAGAVNTAFEMVNAGKHKVIQVLPFQDGSWKLNTDTKTMLSPKELDKVKGYNIHPNSDKPSNKNPTGLITSINNEANLLSRTFDALNNLGTHFISKNSTENSNLTTNSINSQNQEIESVPTTSLNTSPSPETNSINSPEVMQSGEDNESTRTSGVVQHVDTRSTQGTGRNDVETTGDEVGRGQSIQGVQQTGQDVSLLRSEGLGDTGVGLSIDESRGDDSSGADTRGGGVQSTIGTGRDSSSGQSVSIRVSNTQSPTALRSRDGSVEPETKLQETTPKPSLTSDETNVVSSKEFKDWFGDSSEQESARSGQLGRSAGSIESTQNRQTSDSRGASDSRSDDTRQDVRGDDGLNGTSSGNPKKKSTAVGGNTNTHIPVNQPVLLKDVVSLLDRPKDTNYANYLNSLLSKFLGYLPNVNFMLVDNPEAIQDSWERGGIDNDTIGLWGSISNTIYLNKSASNLLELSELEVVTHELQHAITEKVGDDLFNSNSYIAIRDELLSLMQQTANALESNLPSEKVQQVLGYALSHPKEFLAVGTTNLDAINYLKSIKTQGNGQSNLLKQIVNIISNLLGLNSQESNVYLRLIDITGTMADAQNSNPSTVSLNGKLLQQIKSESGLIHHIPENLLGASHKLGDIVNDLLAMTTENVEADQYSIDLLNTIVGFNPNIEVIFVADLQTVNDPIIREGVSLGGFYPISKNGEEKVYIYPRGEWESDVLSLVNHELSHAVTSFIIEKELVASELDILKAYGNMLEDILVTYADQLSDLSVDRIRYASDKVDETQAVLTSEPQVRKELQALISNDVLDLFDSTVESIRITQRDYLNESDKQNKSTSVGTRTSDGGISLTNQGTAGNTASNSSEDPGSSNKQRSSLTTETDQGSSRPTRGNKEHSGVLKGSQREESVTQPNFESSPKVPVPALQGIDKAKRTQERSKPFRQRNLVTAHFDQKINQDETKGNNPLASVRDFISTLTNTNIGYIREFLSDKSQKITSKQAAQLKHFMEFHKKFAPVLSSLKNHKSKAINKRDNLVDFLRDTNGQLDENTLTALSLAAYSYLIPNGSKTFNSEEDIRKILRLEKDDPIPVEAFNLLINMGAELPYVAKDIGKDVSKALGLRVRKDSDPTLQDRLDTSFGLLVTAALHQSGLMTIDADSVNPAALQRIMKAAWYTDSTIGETKRLTFIRSNYNQNKQMMDELVNASKETQGFLSNLFGIDVGFRVPTLVQPGKFTQNAIRQTKSKVPNKQAEYLTKAQQQSFTMRKGTVSVLSTLKNSNADFLKQVLGISVTDEVLKQTHVTQRDALQSKAENEWRTLVNGLDWANSTKDEQGNYQEFYDTQTVSQNLRMSYNSNLFNMQSSQIHRAMASLTGFKTEFNLDLKTEQDQQMYNTYMAAVAEGMEGVEKQIKTDILKTNPNYRFFTIDKVAFSDYLPAFHEWLAREEVGKAVDAMTKLLNQQAIVQAEQDAIAEFVDQGGMGIQSLQSLIALAELQQAVSKGDTQFTSTIGLGSDGVNNGVASANLQTGVISPKMRLQTGIIPVMENQNIQNMQDVYRTGETDYYVDFGEAMKASLLKWLSSTDGEGKVNGNKPWVKAVVALFPAFDPSNNEALAMRKIAKTWSVPFNYSAGRASLQRALANGFIDGIYKQMSGIANSANQAIKDKNADVYRTQQEKLSTLRMQIKQLLWADKGATSNPLVGVKPEQLNEVELGKSVENALKNAVTYAHGKATWTATKEIASDYMAIRDLYTQMETTSFDLYNFVRTKLIEQKTKQAREQGTLDKDGYMGLSSDALAEIDKTLLPMAPLLENGLSIQSENDIASGLSLISQEIRLASDNDQRRTFTSYPYQGNKHLDNRVGINESIETNAGVKGGALAIQGLDATVAAELQAKIAALNVHDAGIFGLQDFTKGTQIQNEAYLQAMINYNLGLEHLQTLMRTYSGLQSFLKSEHGLDASNIEDLYDEILKGKAKMKEGKPVKDDQGEVVRESAGLLSKINNFSSAEGISNLEQAIQSLIQPIVTQDLNKLEVLSDTFAIHQYAGEGGAIKVTDQHRKAIQQQKDALQRKQKALLSQFNNETTEPFVQWFEDRKGKDISKKDLLKHLNASDLTEQERVILTAVEQLIPDSLNVQYVDADFKEHGFYDAKTNTITIKSVGSKGSKVDKHLIIHELLHSALAKRIAAIRENPSTYPEAKQALDKLESLRKELLQSIEQNKNSYTESEYKTLLGMLENVDEFISYGLTDQRLQGILQGIRVGRNGRTAPSIKDRFRTFIMAVAKLLGFPKSKDMDALTAFAVDTAELIQQAEAVIPSVGLDSIHFQRSPATKVSYEDRINQIFGGKVQPTATDTLMLDSSDVLDLLGYGGYEVRLHEKHAIGDGRVNHPEITQADWLNLPEWLDNPAMVVRQVDSKGFETGKLTFFTGEFRGGKPIVIGLSPAEDLNIDRKQLTVTMFAAESKYVKGQLERGEWLYQNKKSSQALLKGLPQTSYPVGLSKDKGTDSIKTEEDLKSYREAFTNTEAVSVNYRKAKSILENLVGKKLSTKTAHVSGLFSLTSVKQSLENVVLTEKAGLPKNVHYVILQQAPALFGNAIQVTSAQISYFAAPVPVASQGKVFVAWFRVSERTGAGRSHNIIEFVKVAPLDPTKPSNYEDKSKAYYKQFKAMEAKVQQQSNTPPTKLKSQYSFDAVQDDEGVQFAQEVLTELSEHDELFKYPKSDKATLQGVFADVVGHAIEYKGEVTAIDERQESTADHKYLYRFKDKDIYVYERDTGEVWIDVSRLEEGDIGSGIYAAVGNYVHNSGKVFIGDPAGLSDAAVVRRTSAMLSLALKFESTRFMEPSVEQRKGDDSRGIAPLEWGNSEVENLRNLIQTFVDTTYNQFKGLDGYYYDFKQQGFFNRLGRPLGHESLDEGATNPVARTARAGEATIRRAIILKSLISSQSSERPRILEQFLSRSQSVKARGLEGIFYSQHSFDANEHVKSMDALEVFEQLDGGSISSKHHQHLNNIIQSTLGSFYNKGDGAKDQMNQLQDQSIDLGFGLSAKEQMVQQATLLALEIYLKSHADSPIKDFIQKSFDTARKALTSNDLSQNQLDYMFKPSMEQDHLARFMSMALASEQVRSKLTMKQEVTKSKDKSWFKKLEDAYHYVMAWLQSKYVHLSPDSPVYQRIDKLTDALMKLDTQARQQQVKWYERAYNSIGLVTTPLNNLLGSTSNKVLNNPLFTHSKYKLLQMMGNTAALSAGNATKNIPQIITTLRNEMKPNERYGAGMELVSELGSSSALKRVMEKLIRQATQHTKVRQNLTDGAKRSLLAAFTENGSQLSKEDHQAVTYSILRTDLQALLGQYSMDDVIGFISDSKKRLAEVRKLEQAITPQANGNDMLIRAKMLGHYMVSNNGGEGLVKNARAIAAGLDTEYQTSEVNSQLVQQLDQLTSLYALGYVNNELVKRTSSLLQAEAEGIKGLIQFHQSMVQDGMRDFEQNPFSYAKGYLPEVTNPHREVRVAESTVERQQLQKEGWEFIADLEEGKALMLHKDQGYQRMVSGAIDMMRTHRKGTEALNRSNPTMPKLVKDRLARAAQRTKQPYQNFDPTKQKAGLIAAYDIDGNVLAYNYEMASFIRDQYLERNHNFADLLGIYAGTNYYKPQVENQHIQVAEVLFEDYKKNYRLNPKAYIAISPHSNDPKIVALWRMLPISFKEEAASLYGKRQPIIVHNSIINMAFGFRKFSIAQLFDDMSGEKNFMEKMFVEFAKGFLGDSAKTKIAKAEHVVQEIVKFAKDIIVIRSITVMWGNIVANALMLLAQGINPMQMLKDIGKAMYVARRYQTTQAKIAGLQAELQMGKNKQEIQAEITRLQSILDQSEMTKFMDAGMLSSIVEDVRIQGNDYSYASEWQKKVDAKTQRIPQGLKDVGAWFMVSPNTPLYQALATATQLGDFVAKYSLFNHLQKKGMSFDEAVYQASSTFINYDVPTSRGLQYMNDMGLFMFTKFFLRFQHILHNLLEKKAASVIGQHMAVEYFTNMPGILDPFAMMRIGNNPFEASALSVFGAVGELPIAPVVY